ncbi:MAG: hypothetical protein FWD28_09870 [Treponema sp.]|nr:hypothetical protein [Treponema sp.]
MRLFFIIGIFLFTVMCLSAQITISGILDSTVSVRADADSEKVTAGLEEYANIRFQSRIQDRAVVHGAVNLIAASGDYALNLAGAGASIGDNFVAVLELERLYFRLRGEHIDMDAGLFRLPFGYGQIWSPCDFLNPKNPLKPDARPRAVMGAAFTWYPIDELKLLGFYTMPRDPFSNEGNGSSFGFSLDKHWEKASIQMLYSYETPDTGSANGIHRAGISLKADIEIGFVVDALYTYNYEAQTELDGLSLSVGADYSLIDGNLILLAAYLYNGENSSTAIDLPYKHNIYAGLTWRFSDFTNLSAALIMSLQDTSYTPLITFNHDLFQGAALTISVQAPFDNDSFIGVFCTARIRLRF